MRKNAAASPKLWQLVKPRPRNHSSCVAYPHAQWFQFEMLNSPWGTFDRTRFSCSNPCTFTATSLEPSFVLGRKLTPSGGNRNRLEAQITLRCVLYALG